MNQEIIAEQIVKELEIAVNNQNESRAMHLFSEAEELDWSKMPEDLDRRYRLAMDKIHQQTT